MKRENMIELDVDAFISTLAVALGSISASSVRCPITTDHCFCMHATGRSPDGGIQQYQDTESGIDILEQRQRKTRSCSLMADGKGLTLFTLYSRAVIGFSALCFV